LNGSGFGLNRAFTNGIVKYVTMATVAANTNPCVKKSNKQTKGGHFD